METVYKYCTCLSVAAKFDSQRFESKNFLLKKKSEKNGKTHGLEHKPEDSQVKNIFL